MRKKTLNKLIGIICFLSGFSAIAQITTKVGSNINQQIEVQNAKPDSSIARVTCATPILSDEYESWLQKTLRKTRRFSAKNKTSTVYNIPVIFHIIHDGEPVGFGRNISQSFIDEQINILNHDYRKTNGDFNSWVTQTDFINAAADCEITFCGAVLSPSGTGLPEPGIDRIDRNVKGWTASPYAGNPSNNTYIENTIKAQSYWDQTKYLNIWVLEIANGILGYSQPPKVPPGTLPITDIVGLGDGSYRDGVVLDYRVIGSNGNLYAPIYSPYNKGRTATHEIGHWLGLRHINGDAPCGNDFVADTPTQNFLSSTCPATAGSAVVSGCSVSPNPPGRMYQNFMDYTYDNCLVMFTSGQKDRMQACMANCINRTSLNTSMVCYNPTSFKEVDFGLNINIYPNPSHGMVEIEWNSIKDEDLKIQIVNSLGQFVKEVDKKFSPKESITIDLTKEPKGLYSLRFTCKTGFFTKRIVLQ